MIKTVIIDDERAGRDSLKGLIGLVSEEFEVAGLADSVESGYALISEVRPKLVFLDILMPPSDGFTLLSKFPRIDFELIFTTAYSEYALQAIKASAVDYLMKPIVLDELKNALERVRQKIETARKENINFLGKLPLPTHESLVFIAPEEILWAETTNDRKSRLKLRTGREIVVVKNFGEMENMLDASLFFRIHRSYIINLTAISRYFPDKSGGYVILTDGKALPIASRKKQEFMEKIGL